MTQQQLALAMEGQVSPDRVSKWERGENRPRDEALDDIARVLKTTVGALLVREPDKSRTPDPFPQPALEGELARILKRIEAQLDAQTRVLGEIKGLRDKDTATADRMEAVSEVLGETAAQLDAQVHETMRGLAAAPPPKRAAARKTARKRNPAA
jgi:transcriptional regulator with XRE-family HTH domain